MLALASAKRVSELSALSREVSFQSGDAFLAYLPEFRAKTESLRNPLPRKFRLKSLTALVGRSSPDRLVCPVRALKFYLQATKDLPRRPRNLFVAVCNKERALSRQAVSFLISKTIAMTHESFRDEDCKVLKVNAHQVRGVATSLNVWRNKQVCRVLDAASWKCSSVFSKHYLKDVERTFKDGYTLGPVIAAGDLVT